MFKKIIIAMISFLIIPSTTYAVLQNAESCVVINADTRQVIYEDNKDKMLGMASTTKIMTAILALENKNTNDLVTVSYNAQNQEGSSIYLRANEKISIENLLYGLMLNSGNDAAVAIAEGVSGDVENFVQMMNDKAREIGCENTHFENPSGLSGKEHYSTAYDMSLIMAYAMENEEFKKIASTKEYQIKGENTITYLKNHNKLLWKMKDFVAGKTGYTKKDGRCLVSFCERDGINLICVTLNDKTDWEDHQNLYDKGFSRIEEVEVLEKNQILATKTIKGKKINLLSGENVLLPLLEGNKKGITCQIFLDDNINDEISQGMKIGVGKILINDFEIKSFDIISGQSVDKNKSESIFFKVLKSTLLK